MKNNPLMALLVEDDPSWQAILKEILNDYGIQTDCADNLGNAVELIRSTNYRLAVVDLSLSGKDHHNHDGLEVLSAIQRFAPSCKGILLTGHASVEVAVAAIQEFHAMTCLQKEYFRRSEFREIIAKALVTPEIPVNGNSRSNANIRSSSLDSTPLFENQFTPLALVVEDDAGWRSLLIELLSDSGFEVHTSSSYGEAIGLLNRDQYNLAIADISLASSVEPKNNQDGYRLLNKTQKSNIPTIIVSGFADPDLIDQAFTEHKIFACFEKQAFDRNAFIQTIRKINENNLFHRNLTKREIEVLSLLAQGLGNKEIANNLHISTNTVKRHLKSIYSKLEVNTRAAASAYAVQQRIGTGI